MSQHDREMAERRAKRIRRIVTNVAQSFEEAQEWDIEFWQSQTPEARINALEELRADQRNIGHANH